MVINHGGNLKKEYFIAYMRLIMNAFGCTVLQAKEITFECIFRLKEDRLGNDTYLQFLQAFEEISEKR